jgi:predicted nuclease with TOPRIM domain
MPASNPAASEEMTLQEQIASRLNEFSDVYGEIATLQKQLSVLQQAEQAQAQYSEETNHLEEEIRRLNLRYKELEAPQQKIKSATAGIRAFRVPSTGTARLDPERVSPARNTAPIHPGNQLLLQSGRTQLKKLVARWGTVWKLTQDTHGQINRIADDLNRPLGEALALLEWTAFAEPIGTSETDEAHLERVEVWGTALVEFRERLRGEIDMLKTRYRLVMPILDAWITRDTESGRLSWENQIAETNAAKEKEVERLRLEIARLTATHEKNCIK